MAQSTKRTVAKSASKYLNDWLVRTCGDTSKQACRPAVVFDVDDTLLDWYALQSQYDFAMPYAQWLAYDVACAMQVNGSIKNLFNRAKRLGAYVFIITGGNDSQRGGIAACLNTHGITGWQELITRSPSQESLTALAYKSHARAVIEKQGWRIGFAIGDQVSDMAGGHTAQGFLLPNPMYFIP
jgi:predicted secreted acid phosphatase